MKTIHLAGSDGNPSARTNVRPPDPFGFKSTCPTCKKAHLQQGYHFRALVTLLISYQQIDAYCAVCNECWPINPDERAELAWLLLSDSCRR